MDDLAQKKELALKVLLLELVKSSLNAKAAIKMIAVTCPESEILKSALDDIDKSADEVITKLDEYFDL